MENKNHSKADQIIRVVTAPPIMAATALTLLYVLLPGMFGGLFNYILALVFLVILPILAYPLQPLIPPFKQQGREGQRNLAIIMSVLGYVGGLAAAAIFKVPPMVWLVYLTYFLSGVGLLVFNKVFKVKASGHSCAIAGPLAFLTWFVGPQALAGAVLLVVACVSSIRMKRHTPWQLVWGGVVSVASFLISLLVLRPGLA